MAKMTLEDLQKLRDAKKNDLQKRDIEGKVFQIIVGMGTCGIAAGAKKLVSEFLSLVDEYNADHDLVEHVMVRQVGCMGLCQSEPTVEVIAPGMPDVVYGKVDAAVAKDIVLKHIIGKELVKGHILDHPATNGAKA
jgi:NADP-reducing hydrogenase subunit HndB